MNKEEFKATLIELLNEDEGLKYGTMEQVIYKIDGLYVYGGFDCGIRGIDHNILLNHLVTWEDVLNFGTIVVPETKTYISNNKQKEFDKIGYTMEHLR